MVEFRKNVGHFCRLGTIIHYSLVIRVLFSQMPALTEHHYPLADANHFPQRWPLTSFHWQMRWHVRHLGNATLLEDWIPDGFRRRRIRVRKNERDDFVWIRLKKGFDFLEVREDGSAIEEGLSWT